MAKAMDLNNSNDLFISAWIKIKNREEKDLSFRVKYHKSFFYRTLRNTFLDQIKSDSKREKREEVYFFSNPDQVNYDWNDEVKALEIWINKKSINKSDHLLKRTMKFYLKDEKTACKKLKISKQTFLKRIKKAKIEIEYEHFKLVDSDTVSFSHMV
jgi:hypothetical protein